MDQTLFIDDKPSKAFQNPRWSILFLTPFRGHEISKNKNVMVRSCILVVVSIERFALRKDG
jgi:hypothetical protein